MYLVFRESTGCLAFETCCELKAIEWCKENGGYYRYVNKGFVVREDKPKNSCYRSN